MTSRSLIGALVRRVPARVRAALRSAAFFGTARHCPLCDRRFRTFLSGGDTRRPDVRCPACGSLERHRFASLLLSRERRPSAGDVVLHVAPERSMVRFLCRTGEIRHVSADLHPAGVDECVDLTALPHPDASFDLVYCSHVLEHVGDDLRAMAEIARVLRPDGLALIQVPIGERNETFEDPAVDDPAERLRLFGQSDHVRIYGADVRQRLESAGLEVTVVRPRDLVDDHEFARMRLNPRERAYLCRRPAAA